MIQSTSAWSECGLARGRIIQLCLIIASACLLVMLQIFKAPPVDDIAVPGSPLGTGGGARIVAIERSGVAGNFRIERLDGDWKMTEPRVDLASKNMVREALRSLEKLEPVRVLPVEKRSEFGLDPPVSQVTLTTYSGEKYTINIGYAAPTSGNIYAAWEGMSGVGLYAPRSLSNFTEIPDFKWREPDLLPPSNCSIDSVHISWANGQSARLQRLSQAEWRFLEPADLVAEALSCERTIAAFWRFAFNRFFDSPTAPEELGLINPAAQWIIFRCGQVDTLRIGDRLPDNLMAVQLAGRAPGEVRDDLYNFLAGGRHLLMVCQPLTGDGDQIERIAILDAQGQRGRLWRRQSRQWDVRDLTPREVNELSIPVSVDLAPPADGDDWIIASDPTFSGDLQNLFNNKGDRFLPKVASAAGFDSHQYRCLFWDQEGQTQWALLETDLLVEVDGTVDPADFRCTVLGSRFPDQPIHFDQGPVYLKWIMRFLKPLNPQSRTN